MPFLPDTALLAAAPAWWPPAVLILGVAFTVVTVAVLRLHPFFALVLAAVLVGFLSPDLPAAAGQSRWVRALELPMEELGITAGKIALPIALAAVIGACLLQSGAAQSIVGGLLRVLGERMAPAALLVSGFLLSIPVFFDTVFFLLVPLARALAVRLGRNYVLNILAICGGAVLTHSLVAPTPGPLLMAENLGIDLGLSILAGLAASAILALAVLPAAAWLGRRTPVPAPVADSGTAPPDAETLPPFLLSILPIALPVILISAASLAGLAPEGFAPESLREILAVLGNKNLALFLGTAVAVALVVRREGADRYALQRLVEGPFQTAGAIILITSAGGAFGAMIGHSGISGTLASLAGSPHLDVVLLAWLLSSALKIAQGSGTVAMITASSLLQGVLAQGAGAGVHPLFVFLAIGCGSFSLSWMNDSAFWVVGRLSGFDERQTLRLWTCLLSILSVTGFLLVWVASKLAA